MTVFGSAPPVTVTVTVTGEDFIVDTNDGVPTVKAAGPLAPDNVVADSTVDEGETPDALADRARA